MTEFTLKLADVPIAARVLYPETERFCRQYLTAEPAALSVAVAGEDVEAERARSAAQDRREGREPYPWPDAYLETLALYRKIAEELISRDVLLVHGSAVAVDGTAYLFTARSGTGKSTHTRLWREYFGSRAVMVNDDKPLLKFTPSGVLACGTPWDGKHRLSGNVMVPLRAVCVLTRDKTNHIEPLTPGEAFPELLRQSYRPESTEGMERVLELLDRLTRRAGLYRLGCNMELKAALVAYQGMRERRAR